MPIVTRRRLPLRLKGNCARCGYRRRNARTALDLDVLRWSIRCLKCGYTTLADDERICRLRSSRYGFVPVHVVERNLDGLLQKLEEQMRQAFRVPPSMLTTSPKLEEW